MSIDRKKAREAILEATPETNANALADMLDICAEFAKELKLELPDLIRGITSAYCEVNDLELTHFECEKDQTPDGKGQPLGGYATVVATVSKWRDN